LDAKQARSRSITCWGTGNASRQFLHVADAAEGMVRAAELVDEPVPINLGGGEEIKIKDLVNAIAKISGFHGEIEWDASKPDGQPRRAISIDRATALLSWQPKEDFEHGIRETIEWWNLINKATELGNQSQAVIPEKVAA
jgi:nucleoside-diphosphate-sugar epimerase